MSRPLAALERFFERIFERPAARLFGTRVEPVQVRHRLERAMDAAPRGPGGTTPGRYLVRVNPGDLAGLGDAVPSFVASLVAHARGRGYRLPGRPVIELAGDPSVAPGDFEVQPVAAAAVGGSPAPQGGAPGPSPADLQAGAPPEATMVFEAPVSRVPRVVLLVETPGQPVRAYPVRAASIRLGRGPENDLDLADTRVSRAHGLLSARQGGLVYSDLGSTNGSFVNGSRVAEVALGPGDVLRVGDTTITVSLGT